MPKGVVRKFLKDDSSVLHWPLVQAGMSSKRGLGTVTPSAPHPPTPQCVWKPCLTEEEGSYSALLCPVLFRTPPSGSVLPETTTPSMPSSRPDYTCSVTLKAHLLLTTRGS